MHINKIIRGLEELLDYRRSFITGDADHDKVFEFDIKVLEGAIEILKLQLANVFFECDKKACRECNNDFCHLTSKLDNAKNFIKSYKGDYIESSNMTDDEIKQIKGELIGK